MNKRVECCNFALSKIQKYERVQVIILSYGHDLDGMWQNKQNF